MKNHPATALFAALLLALAFAEALPAQHRVYRPRDLNVPSGIDTDKLKDAGNAGLEDLIGSMLGRQDLPKKFAILPLERDVDGEYFTMQMRNFFTNLGRQNGYELYTRNDDQWNQILEEIKWGDQFGDTMDAATVQKFGRIQGVQGLLMGRVSGISTDKDGNPVVRLTLQAFEVETGRQVWGDEAKGTIGKLEKMQSGSEWYQQIPRKWLVIGGAALGALVVILLVRSIASAARPR